MSNEENEYFGLCITCIYLKNCTTLKSFKGKILLCEEFETQGSIPENAPQLEAENCDSKADMENYSGLCKNCELRKKCMNYNPDKIIWHCEEYL